MATIDRELASWPAKVGIYRNGKLSRVTTFENPAVAFAEGFNRDFNRYGSSAVILSAMKVETHRGDVVRVVEFEDPAARFVREFNAEFGVYGSTAKLLPPDAKVRSRPRYFRLGFYDPTAPRGRVQLTAEPYFDSPRSRWQAARLIAAMNRRLTRDRLAVVLGAFPIDEDGRVIRTRKQAKGRTYVVDGIPCRS